MDKFDKVYKYGTILGPKTELIFMGFTERGDPILRDEHNRDFIDKNTAVLAKVEIVWRYGNR